MLISSLVRLLISHMRAQTSQNTQNSEAQQEIHTFEKRQRICKLLWLLLWLWLQLRPLLYFSVTFEKKEKKWKIVSKTNKNLRITNGRDKILLNCERYHEMVNQVPEMLLNPFAKQNIFFAENRKTQTNNKKTQFEDCPCVMKKNFRTFCCYRNGIKKNLNIIDNN